MRIPKKIIALISVVVVSGSGMCSISNASEVDDFVFKISGESRVQTSTNISKNSWSKSKEVVIVNDESVADALAVSPFADANNSPILLNPKDKLNKEVKDEIKRLGAEKVYLIGGEKVLSKNIEKELKNQNIKIERIRGSNKEGTSLEIAKKLNEIKKVSQVAIVNLDSGIADAMNIASVAAEKYMPILFSNSQNGTKSYDDFIKNNKISKSYIIGDEDAISKDIEKNLPAPTRIAGSNPGETNARIIEKFYDETEIKNLYISKSYISNQVEAMDSVLTSLLAAKNNSPNLIVGNKIDQEQKDLIDSKNIKQVVHIGDNNTKHVANKIKASQNSEIYEVKNVKQLKEKLKTCDANDVINFKPSKVLDKNIIIQTNKAITINLNGEYKGTVRLNSPNAKINNNAKIENLVIRNSNKLNIINNKDGKIKNIEIKKSSSNISIENNGYILNIKNDAKNTNINNKGNIINTPTGSKNVELKGSQPSSLGNSNGSSSLGGSSNLGTEVNKPPVQEQTSLIYESQSKIVKVEGTSYAVVSLEKGTINDSKFTLNNQSITPTPVNTEGTIVKFEINPNEVAKINVNQGDLTDVLILNKNGKEFTKVIQNEAPDKVMVSGPINKYDYHKTNHDSQGNIRINPDKTTFSLEKTNYENENVPKLSSQETKLGEDVVISFDAQHKNASDWKNNITSVEVVYPDIVLTSKLQYSVENDKIILDADSTPINGINGRHIVKVKSKGYDDTKVMIEIVKKAGKINLSSNFDYISNNALLFELDGFDYAVKNPVHEVLLDGKVLKGDFVEYHVLSNLITLENKCIDKLTKGKHKLTVKVHGYEDFSKSFYLEEPQFGQSNPQTTHNLDKKNSDKVKQIKNVDVVTSATQDTSDGGSPGSKVIRANLIYDFDLLSNAMVLKSIDKETKESKAVLNWWSQMNKDAILTDGSDKVISYKGYKNTLNESVANGEYMTFKQYYDSKASSDYLNKPYNVKYILQDGLLGEVQPYAQENLKSVPKTNIKNQENEIIVTFEGDESYTQSIKDILVGYNSLSKEKYKIDKNKITITDKSEFIKGKNNIKIVANGYKDNNLELDLLNEVSNLEINKDKNQNIMIKLNKEFKEKIKGISLNGKVLYNELQVGNDNNYYYHEEYLVIKSNSFKNLSSQYTLIINADEYTDTVVTFTPNDLSELGYKEKEIPNYVKLNDKNTYKNNERLMIVVEDVLNAEYKTKIQKVLVNGKSVDYKTSVDEFYSIEIDGKNFNESGNYNIAIKSDGYKDFEVNSEIIKEKIQIPTINASKNILQQYVFESESKYISTIVDVKVNETSLEKIDWSINENNLTITSKNIKSGDKIYLKSNDYEDFEYKVQNKQIGEISISKNSDNIYALSSRDYSWSDSVEVFINEELLNKEDYEAKNGKIKILKSINIGENITVKSNGFDDYNYIVELLDNNVSMVYSSFNKKYSFNSTNNNWKENIKTVKINDIEIELSSDYSPKGGYKFNYASGMDIYTELNKGDVVNIQSDGYKDYTYII